MTRLAIFCLMITAACTSESPYTWGEASRGVASGYCHAMEDCGWFSKPKEEGPKCESHTIFHLCTINNNCWYPLEGGAEELVVTCQEDLDAEAYHDWNSAECFFLGFFGQIPTSCVAVLNLDPSITPDAGM